MHRRLNLKNAYFAMISISILYLLIYYNDNGNMHDAGVYVDSGLAVFKGENPYDFGTRFGTFGPLPFSLLLMIFPDVLQAAVVRLLSLAGIYIFLRTFFPTKVEMDRYLIFLVIIWCSPSRELMVTNQLTGICIGLVALGVKIHELHGRYKYSKTLEIVSATLFAIALDMKPHITIIFFISWCIYRKSIKLFAYVIIVLMSTHALIDFSQNKILELDWLANLRGVNSSAIQSTLGDSLSFWPILNNYIAGGKIFYYFSIILVLFFLILCINLSKKGNYETMIFCSFLTPSLFIYFHFYDVVPLTVILAILVLRVKNHVLVAFSISMYLIPIEYMSIKNTILVYAFIILLTVRKSKRLEKTIWIRNSLLSIIGWAMSYLLHTFNSILGLSDHLLQSLIVTECLIIVTVLFYYSKRKEISLI